MLEVREEGEQEQLVAAGNESKGEQSGDWKPESEVKPWGRFEIRRVIPKVKWIPGCYNPAGIAITEQASNTTYPAHSLPLR